MQASFSPWQSQAPSACSTINGIGSTAKVILDKQTNIACVRYAFSGSFTLDRIQKTLGQAHIQRGGLCLELEMRGLKARKIELRQISRFDELFCRVITLDGWHGFMNVIFHSGLSLYALRQAQGERKLKTFPSRISSARKTKAQQILGSGSSSSSCTRRSPNSVSSTSPCGAETTHPMRAASCPSASPRHASSTASA